VLFRSPQNPKTPQLMNWKTFEFNSFYFSIISKTLFNGQILLTQQG
jgi:hypothetical protein